MYTVDYFIKKFEAIPESNWTVGQYDNGRGSFCALGHCGLNYKPEDKEIFGTPYGEEQGSLYKLFGDSFDKHMAGFNSTVADINDGKHEQYKQSTPKQRILAALHDIKKMQQPVYEDVTKSLAVLPVSETSDLVNTKQPTHD